CPSLGSGDTRRASRLVRPQTTDCVAESSRSELSDRFVLRRKPNHCGAERNPSKLPTYAPIVDSPVTFSSREPRTRGYFARLSRQCQKLKTDWRMAQSAANQSPLSSSLLSRELTGKFGVSGP